MSVDTATASHIAKLARLAMSEAELEAMVPELNAILGFVEQLAEVDTEGASVSVLVVDGGAVDGLGGARGSSSPTDVSSASWLRTAATKNCCMSL